MSSMNRVTLIGNVGADPEIRTAGSGKVANLRIATSETWKDRDGDRKEKTEWHNVVVWSEGLVGVIERYVKKGSKLLLEGKLQTRKWQDQSGADRYSVEVVLQGFDAKMLMLDGKGGQGSGQAEDRTYGSDNRTAAQSHQETRSVARDLDDDVPF